MIDSRNVEAFCEAKNAQTQRSFKVIGHEGFIEVINADRFEFTPLFLIFYKGLSQVAARSASSVKSIDLR